jgi:hypothetical protein
VEAVTLWFRVLSLVIGVALLSKAATALFARRRFYAERQRQYASASQPPNLLVAPAVILAVTSAAWYATIFQYRPWGWVVTGSLTALSCLSLDHVFRWERHRQRMLKVVSSQNVWQVDCLLLLAGTAFVVLALLVY